MSDYEPWHWTQCATCTNPVRALLTAVTSTVTVCGECWAALVAKSKAKEPKEAR